MNLAFDVDNGCTRTAKFVCEHPELRFNNFRCIDQNCNAVMKLAAFENYNIYGKVQPYFYASSSPRHIEGCKYKIEAKRHIIDPNGGHEGFVYLRMHKILDLGDLLPEIKPYPPTNQIRPGRSVSTKKVSTKNQKSRKTTTINFSEIVDDYLNNPSIRETELSIKNIVSGTYQSIFHYPNSHDETEDVKIFITQINFAKGITKKFYYENGITSVKLLNRYHNKNYEIHFKNTSFKFKEEIEKQFNEKFKEVQISKKRINLFLIGKQKESVIEAIVPIYEFRTVETSFALNI